MNVPSASDVSLYELALNSQQPPQPLQISAATLKSMVEVTVDFLIEQQISATLLVKLPFKKAWQDEIDRYRRSDVCRAIYLCQTTASEQDLQVDELSSVTENWQQVSDSSPQPAKGPLPHSAAKAGAYARRVEAARPNAEEKFLGRAPNVSAQGEMRKRQTGQKPTNSPNVERSEGLEMAGKVASPLFRFRLAEESSLKREYFVLVLSAQFCGTIIAHRPRSVRLSVEETTDSARSSQLLLGLCSFDRQTMRRVLEGLRVAIARTPETILPDSAPVGEGAEGADKEMVWVTAEAMQANWQSLFVSWLDAPKVEGVDFSLYASLLWGKQAQQQEEIWRSVVSYRKQSADADVLHLQNEELLEALHLKDEFLSNVGQALRTPLTNMKTALSLLSSPNLKAAQRERYLQLLNAECDRQTSLINGMLELVQLDNVAEGSTLQSLRLADIVPGVVSTYQPLAQEKGIMLAYTVPINLPPISCLRPWLKQIVINLLDNGIKFTPTGGQVWVRAKQQGDYVQIEFRDTGSGIPTNEIPKIFERFYRVRSAVDDYPGGAGLGLTIVQQLLLRCGGSISVNSKLGEGSTFKVLLPIYHSASPE